MSNAPRTDYENIAPSYDDDRKQWEIPADDVIATGTVRDVLDVGCGTALWLTAQGRHHPAAISWTGVDPSPGMLSEARAKAPDLRLVNAFAEAIPFANESFDYVYSSFVYHHFTDKNAAFDEIARVLRRHGTLRIRNIDPVHMEGWWVYRYFPKTRPVDERRFWTTAALVEALERCGFDVETRIDPETRRQPAREILEEAERRVVSQLAILDEVDFRSGLEELRDLPEDDPIETQWALLTLTATLGRR